MKIYFVRHGHPNYKDDCLTELGHKQAEAAAERLKKIPFDGIFSSTNGRAMETAGHTARHLGMEVVGFDFMRELSWKIHSEETEDPALAKCTPWKYARTVCPSLGQKIPGDEWQELDLFAGSKLLETYQRAVNGFDAWLSELGYTREGDYYRVTGSDTDKTIAMFSHGGASSAVISHLIGIPFLLFCKTFEIDHTSISVVELSNEQGALFAPKVLVLNDAEHIQTVEQSVTSAF